MKTFLIISGVLLFLVGCAEKLTEDSLNEKTNSHFQKNEYNEAEIALKQFLVNNPESLLARNLLAQAQISQGSYDEGIQQWMKNQSQADEQLEQLLLEAFYFTDDNESAVEFYNQKFEQSTKPTKSDFIYALIQTKIQKTPDTFLNYTLKHANDPKNPLSQLFHAIRNLQVDGDSLAFSDAIDAVNENSTEVANWPVLTSILGGIYLTNNDLPRAISTYKNFIDLRPKYYFAYLSYIDVLIKNKDYEKASFELNRILAISPTHPVANRLKAALAMQQNDYVTAKDHIEKAINYGYTTQQNYLAAGSVNYILGNYEQTISHLQKGLKDSGDYTRYHQMLDYSVARTADNKVEQENFTVKDKDDVTRLKTLLNGFIESGNVSGIKAIHSALELNASSDINTRFETLLLAPPAFNDVEAQLQALAKQIVKENSSANNLTVFKARIIYLQTLVKEKKLNEAITTAKSWTTSENSSTVDYIILSDLYSVNGELDKALATLESVDDQNKNHLVYQKIAALQHANKKYTLAIEAIKKSLQLNKYSIESLKHLVVNQNKLGERDDIFVNEIYKNQRILENDAIFLSMYLAMHNDVSQSIKVLNDLDSVVPKSANFYYTLTEHYLQVNDRDAAILTIKNVTDIKEISLQIVPDILNLLNDLTLYDTQNAVLNNLITAYPASDYLKIKLAELKVLTRTPKEALEVLNGINPNERVNQLYGIAYRNQGQLNKAEESFKKSYDTYKSEDSLILYVNHLYVMGETTTPNSLLNNFIENNSDSVKARNFLASKTTVEGRAVKLYEEVLQIDPNNVFALTNLAELYFENNNKDSAVRLIDTAHALAPHNAQITEIHTKIKS